MRKNTKLVVVGLVTAFATCALVFPNANAAVVSIELNPHNIANSIHLNNIKAKQYDAQSLSQYLGQLNLNELLETAAEFAGDGEFTLEQDGTALVPYFKRKFEAGVPFPEIHKLIKDKKNNNKFRLFLVDSSTQSNHRMPFEEVNNLLFELAQDKSESKMIRSYALMKIRKPSANSVKKKEQEAVLLSIFQNETADPSVRAATITAMRRVGHPKISEVVTAVMANTSQYPDLVVRHAIVAGAKANLPQDVAAVAELANTTTNPEVFGSTVYAMGLHGGVGAVSSLVSLNGKHDDHIVMYSLQENQSTILSMLDLSQPEAVTSAGISAAQIIKLPSSVDKLQRIASGAKQSKLRVQAQNAIDEINATEKSGVPSNAHKWED